MNLHPDSAVDEEPGRVPRPGVIRFTLYAQLITAILAAAFYVCTPNTCRSMYGSGVLAGVVNFFYDIVIVFVAPLMGVVGPLVILGASFVQRIGWLRGAAVVVLSLALTYLVLGIWVAVFS